VCSKDHHDMLNHGIFLSESGFGASTVKPAGQKAYVTRSAGRI
jgi:hypothetical protein